MRKFLFGLFLALICSAGASAQTLCQWRDTLSNSIGQVIPGATVIVLSGTLTGAAAVNTSTQPGTPLLTIYSEPYGAAPINQLTNPLNTSTGDGTFQFWATCGSYAVIQAYGPQIAGQYLYGIRIAGSSTAGTPGGINGNLQFNLSGNFGGTSGINSPDGNQLHIKGPVPWVDATQYGMRTLSTFNTITVTTNGSTSVSSTGVGDFIVNDGIAIPAAGAATTQSTPSAPTVTVPGATGAQTVSYECVGVDQQYGLTAASAAGTATTVPTVFGNPATQISSIARSSNVVTVNTSSPMPFSSGTYHAVIANVTGGSTQFSGLQAVTVTGATTATYSQTGANESGTTVTGSYILFKNAFIITTAQATAGSNQVVLTTDVNHDIPFISSSTRPVRIYVDGIKFAAATTPSYADGVFAVAAVTANTITIDTTYVSPITVTGTADAASATSSVAQMTVTNWAVVDVACPAISGTTQYYAVYGNYGSGYAPVGFTPWGLNILEDYGPAFTQTGLVLPPVMGLPATPPVSAQAQVYVGQITNISGSTLTVTPSVTGSVTSVSARHDNGIALNNALAAACTNNQFAPVYLPASTVTGLGWYLFSAPLDLSGSGCNRAVILDGGPVWPDGTIYGSTLGTIEWSRPRSTAGCSNITTGGNSGCQTYIFGDAPTMMAFTNSVKFDGMDMRTRSNGQTGLMLTGGSGGNLNNPEISNSTFETRGTLNLSSVPLYLFNVSFGVQLHNITFEGTDNWMYPVTQAQPNNSLGDPCFWPVPSIEVTGAFVPRFKMDGINYAVYRGIQFDALYPNTHTVADVDISDVNTFQAPQQGLLNIYGSSAGIDGLKLTRVVMDSVINPVVACTVFGSVCQNGTFVNEWSNNNGPGNLMSGPPWGSTFDILINGGHPTTNMNDCSLKAGTFLCNGISDGVTHTVVTTSASPSLMDGYSKTIANNQDATAAEAVTYTLPVAVAGKTKCIVNSNNGSAPDTGVLTLQTSGSGQYIIFTDGTLSASGGYVSSGGAAADNACVQGVDATHWQLFVQSGTWAKH